MTDRNIRRLGDAIRQVDPLQLPTTLRLRGREIVAFADSAFSAVPRTDLSFAIQGLVHRIGTELVRCADRPDDAEHAGRAVRNVFEVNLIIRYVLDHQDNLMNWLAVRVREEMDILSGVLHFNEARKDDPLVQPILARIAELEQHLRDRGLDMPKRLPRWDILASKYNADADYKALYGVFSKYIHPSAWTIVKPDASWDPMFAEVFVIHIQLYAFDATARAAEGLGVDIDSLLHGEWAALRV